MSADTNFVSRSASRPLIAPAWHTIVFVAIFVGLSVIGGFFQHAVKQHPQAAVPSGNAVQRYLSVLVFEWLLVLYVRMGVHKRGVRLRDLVGGRWATAKEVMKDIALGGGLYGSACRTLISSAVERMPRKDFFLKEFLRALRGYLWPSQQDFVRNWLFAAIFRSNFRRSQATWGGQC